MKKIQRAGLLVLSLGLSVFSFAQKTISEGTIMYDIVIQSANKEPRMADALDGGTVTVYLKGAQSRSDMVSSIGKESTIHDTKTGNAVILKEYSSQKLMITLTKDNWAEKNKAYNDIKFDITDETKIIAGYTCKKAIAKMPNGKTFTVYYSPDVVVTNKEYDATFKNLPGLAMQYESGSANYKYTLTLSKINFEPVAASKFDIPKSGYRVMTYDENQQMRKGGQ
ncbi:GLPGLI family protein [Ferruginibacter sp. SUN106]|uniref:GLPGLI family protein n=1 Tax=Ferruginibacter sp. SUN106 TaxID=2978348 RepID=UPI003D35F182